MSQKLSLVPSSLPAIVMSQYQKYFDFLQTPVFVIPQLLSQCQDHPELIQIRRFFCFCDVTKSFI